MAALLLAAWALAVAVFDFKQRRVPNLLLLLVAVPACGALAIGEGGLLRVGAVPAVVGAVLGAALLLPGYALKQVGAGDVKLAAVLGLLLGLGVLWVLLVAAVVLGAMAVAARLRAREGRYRLPAAVALAAGFECWLLHISLLPGVES